MSSGSQKKTRPPTPPPQKPAEPCRVSLPQPPQRVETNAEPLEQELHDWPEAPSAQESADEMVDFTAAVTGGRTWTQPNRSTANGMFWQRTMIPVSATCGVLGIAASLTGLLGSEDGVFGEVPKAALIGLLFSGSLLLLLTGVLMSIVARAKRASPS